MPGINNCGVTPYVQLPVKAVVEEISVAHQSHCDAASLGQYTSPAAFHFMG